MEAKRSNRNPPPVFPGGCDSRTSDNVAAWGDGGVPVICHSARGQEQLVARALDEGAADYLVKPFAPVELVARRRPSRPNPKCRAI